MQWPGAVVLLLTTKSAHTTRRTQQERQRAMEASPGRSNCLLQAWRRI